VVDAVVRQTKTLNTHTRYLHELILDYAERLLATVPDTLGHLMLTCTGSEANDLAYRIAKAFAGATGVIVTSMAYHGISDAVSQMSPSLGDYVGLGPHVRAVRAPDSYRQGGADMGTAFAEEVRRAIADLKANGHGIAALYVDTILSSDGVQSDPPGFLDEAVAAVQAAGGLYIADEVQPGFGRTGAGMWGFSRHGAAPDMVTIGKPMGNGQPVAGVIMRPELVAEFGQKARYFNTFAGNPVSCAAALAVLDVIEREALIDNARRVGEQLMAGFRELGNKHEGIGDVRGAGLFVGVEFVKDRATRAPDADAALRLVNDLRRRRILISASGPFGNVLKIRPPLVFSSANAELLLESVDAALTEAATS
jgi:4-aminobutyrate aminotransferase-like enzyme